MKKTFIIASVLTIMDQIIKHIIINLLSINESIRIIKNFFNITLVLNDGAAFSILRDKTFILIIITLVVLISLIVYIIRSKDLKKIEYIIYGILMGGILGNFIDRLIYSSVIDYLDFNIFGYPFPIFNFADTCIVISMGLIIIEMIKGGVNEDKSRRRN